MSDRVLFVDDEQDVLDGLERLLRREFDVRTARGGEVALAEIKDHGPFAVVISDMRMPGMNGAEFLAQVRQRAPSTARMLLTGFADVNAAIAAVNEGNILRFLTKPCPKEVLIDAIHIGVAQYRQTTAERKLVAESDPPEISTRSASEDILCQWDNCDGPTGLPGPTQARHFVKSMLGSKLDGFVAMLKLSAFQTVEMRYGEGPAIDYLNSVAQSIVQGLESCDRVFHWGWDILMVVLIRNASEASVRAELARVIASRPENLVEFKGRKLMIATRLGLEMVPVARFTKFDDMIIALDTKVCGRE